MTKWQYLTVYPDDYFEEQNNGYVDNGQFLGSDVDALYNRLGDQGWELVAARFSSAPRKTGNVIVTEHDRFIFKRPKP